MEQILAENIHGTGGIISPTDERDLKWGTHLGMGAVPFSWSLGYDVFPKLPNGGLHIKDQDGSGSCGGQAFSYYAEVLDAIATKSQEIRSAKYIYEQTNVPPQGGSYARDNADILVNQGCAKESVCTSYDQGNPPSEAFMISKTITDEMRADAALSKEAFYAFVPLTIDDCAQAVANNYGAVILIRGINNGTWLSKFPQSELLTDQHWGHFLYVAGALLINGKKYLKCVNSWGENGVGENGIQYIDEKFFTDGCITEVRTLVYKDVPPQFVFNKNLNIGMRNGDVLQLQHRLVDEGFATFTPTGYFGWATFSAVRKYQIAHNILSTGFVGTLTRAALNVVK